MNLTHGQGFYRWQPAACLRVSGEDAFTFLQGQFTNELQQPAQDGAVYGLWLNQKGKVLADSFVRKISAQDWRVLSYFSSAAVIRERLEPYIVADDVVIEDLTADTVGLTLLGALSATAMGLQADAWEFRGRRMPELHTEIIFPASAEFEVTPKLAGGISLTAGQMALKRIAAAIPAVPADIGPADLPNEAGLESAAISYTKGCYLGQEVMARLKSMGQVRRRLVRVHGCGGPPACPAALFQSERKVGELRSVAREGVNWIGLAMVSLVQLRRDSGLALTPDGAVDIRLADAT
jgi:folate-binding protein YgfZ